MSVALKNMLNAMYSRDLSRKVRSAMKTHAKNGEYMPAFPKYGYIKDPEDKHHLVIDPEAAEIVKLIFTMAADGRTKGQIAKHLNETHVLTCREYMCRKGIKMHRENEKEKKLWSVTTISDMLKNEVYLGKIIWNKKRVARTGSNKLVSNDKEEWIVVENAHEPIISDELFQKANEKAFTNQKRVLTKRGVACPIFFCPTCGRRLGFTSRETGYRCMQAHISGLSGCAESKMDRKEAEETVLDAARNMAQLISENLEKKKSEWHKTILKEENIATLESEKKRLSSRKMKLYSDYRSEVLDKEGYMEELKKTTSRISEITLQIAELENEIAVAKKKCDEATEKEMEVNEIAALQDFDKIQLSKIMEGEADLEEILDGLGGGFYMSTRVKGVPKGSGLGTSSILSGAAVRAIGEFLGTNWTDSDVYELVLNLEQIMSTGGGWQDQVGGLTGGVKYITSRPGMKQKLRVEYPELDEATKTELQERFALIYTGQRRLARNLLRYVVGNYIGGRKESREALEEMKHLAVMMRYELEQGDIDAFAQLLNRHWEVSKKLDEGSTNTCIDQIFATCEDLIDGKFISGAGGGGFLQVILKKGVTKEELRKRLLRVYQDSGVDVWDTEFVW